MSRRFPELPVAAVAAVGQFCELIERYREIVSHGRLVLSRATTAGRSRLPGRNRAAVQRSQRADARWNAVEEVINALAGYAERAKRPTLAGFIEDVAMAGRDDNDDKESRLARRTPWC